MTKTKILLGLVLSISFGFSTVLAQNTSQFPIQISTCVGLSNNMNYRARDAFTNGDVSRLQSYLNSKGYLSVSATGYFGPMTLRAVQKFQSENGLFSAGYVGPLTRAKISSLSCGDIQTSLPVVYSVSPSSGLVGSQVTINGSNFTSDTKVSFASGYASSIFVSSNKITFTVPSEIAPSCYYSTPRCYLFVAARQVVPGDYTISVENSNGISNSINFTVTSGTQNNNAPVINGLDAPTSLNVDQAGTWKVWATDVAGSGLNYEVKWGDEVYATTNTTKTSLPVLPNWQNSTFTHVYHSAGTYTAVFTVTGSNGQSAQASASVIVKNNAQVPVINYLSPTSGRVGTNVMIYGSGFSSTNTVLFDGGPVNNVVSNSGTSMTFNVPEYVGIDCAPNMYCTMIARQITLGTHPVVVRNSNGVSNTLYYTVTN